MSPFAAAACFAERIKVNSITRTVHEGRPVFLKRRRRSARLILTAANGFFRLAGNPVQALIALPEWQRWEVECFRQLHGAACFVAARDPRTIVAEAFPGISLGQALEEKRLTPAMAAAAGRELRRCHESTCPTFPDHWSHGDPHAGNFIYDADTDRARLIDFEVRHHLDLPAADRRADDLLIFLQDVVGRVTPSEWLRLAPAFIAAYDDPDIAARLRTRLVVPRGIPRLWWAVRTTYLPTAELARRLELLHAELAPAGVTV